MSLLIKNLGLTSYQETWKAMKDHIKSQPETDEIWLTEHPPIFTTGLNKKESMLPKSDIPHLFVDRGGKITYHGPGQIIIYILVNLKRNNLTIRKLISILESSVITLLLKYKIESYAKKEAPGIYIKQKKIASVGLRIKKGFTYHGLSINIKMDLAPFTIINPCGFSDLKMAQLSDFLDNINIKEIQNCLIKNIQKEFK
jgi:lipoyl(octanoyl) transferase